jgi:F-type H+-transporting ATPase subunit b
VTLLDLFSAAQTWASEAAEAEHHAPSINGIWFPLINFLMYAFILVKYVLPRVRDFLKTRHQEVATKVEQASAKKRAAEALVQEYKTRLANADKEAQVIIGELRADGEREKAKLVGEAQGMAVKIKADANFLADQEVKGARQKVREEMAEQAVATARQLVARHLSSADQSRLAEEFVRTIG